MMTATTIAKCLVPAAAGLALLVAGSGLHASDHAHPSHPGMESHGHHSGGHGNPMAHLHAALMKLELSEDQKRRLHEMLMEEHEQVQSALQGFDEVHAALMLQVHGSEFDERAIRRAAKKTADAQLNLALEMAGLLEKVRAELTDEQRESLEKMVQAHVEGMSSGTMR